MNHNGPGKPDPWHLHTPFWRSKHVFGESLFFIRETPGEPAGARLLFPPTDSLRITSASREKLYANNIDYVVRPGSRVVTLTRNSGIPFTDRTALYPAVGQEHSISHRCGETETGLYFSEGHFLHDQQLEASYDHHSNWQGYRPTYQPDTLPKTIARLKAAAPLKICVCGDSISEGSNASGLTGTPPAMPPYPELFAEGLRAIFGGSVVLKNFAVGGKRVEHGLEIIDELLQENPNLVIIAYGMNDVCVKTADQYRMYITRTVDKIRATTPDADIILVASMLGNPEWVHTPTKQFFAYRDAMHSLCGEGLILADLTQLWADLLQYKSYHDLTGNGVNHPNDFGHRIYAQVLLDLLANQHS